MDWTGGDVTLAQLGSVVSGSNLVLLRKVGAELQQRRLAGSSAVAAATIRTLRSVVATSKFWDSERLVLILRLSGRYLQQCQPAEPAVGNTTLRILALLREELATLPASASASASKPLPSGSKTTIRGLLGHAGTERQAPQPTEGAGASAAPAEPAKDYGTLGNKFLIEPGEEEESSDQEEAPERTRGIAHQLKPVLAEMMQEMIDELELTNVNISKLAKQQVHSGELILTLGRSSAVEAFLKAAAKERTFTVLVLESAPGMWGHSTAADLAKAGIHTLLVPDASLYAWMPKVSKVLLGAHFVLANGSVVLESGGAVLAKAAAIHATPFTVVTGTYKICPNWERALGGRSAPLPYVYRALEFSYPPGQALPTDEKVSSRAAEGTEIVAPMYDLVPAKHIQALFTNVGGFPTSHVSRVVKDQYLDADVRALA